MGYKDRDDCTTIVGVYRIRGFRVIGIAADYAFEPMEKVEAFQELKVPINVAAEDEHEPYSKRFNQTPKKEFTYTHRDDTPYGGVDDDDLVQDDGDVTHDNGVVANKSEAAPFSDDNQNDDRGDEFFDTKIIIPED